MSRVIVVLDVDEKKLRSFYPEEEYDLCDAVKEDLGWCEISGIAPVKVEKTE